MRFQFSVCPLFLLVTTLVVSVASGQQQDATTTADASNATPLKKKKLEGKKQIHIPPGITTRVVGGTQVRIMYHIGLVVYKYLLGREERNLILHL